MMHSLEVRAPFAGVLVDLEHHGPGQRLRAGDRIGKVMEVDIPRPRTRKALLEHPDYYLYREQVLDFLEEYEKGAHKTPPDPQPETKTGTEAA